MMKCLKGGDEMTNCVNPDQGAPLGEVCSECTLFAQTYLSEYCG